MSNGTDSYAKAVTIGRGGKTKYQEEDIVFLEECLKKEPRTYNSLQLAQKLESDLP